MNYLILVIKDFIIYKIMNYLKYIFFNLNKKIKVGNNLRSGRNFSGVICVHHRFGGNKIKRFNIDWYRRIELYGYVYKIIIDNNRTAYIGSIIYENGLYANIILSDKVSLGQKIYSGILNKDIKAGFTCLLSNIKLFTIINNLELYPNKGFTLVRSAGVSSLLTSINNNIATVKLKSGYNIFLLISSLVNLGLVSNMSYRFNNLKKAGKT